MQEISHLSWGRCTAQAMMASIQLGWLALCFPIIWTMDICLFQLPEGRLSVQPS